MSTRGAIGFRKDGVDKVTYNHSDSYPDWLLRKVVEFASQHTDLALNNMFDRIELVNEGDVPTPDQIEVYNKYSNTNVGIQSSESWYCLLRETQGDLEVYSLLGGCTHMIDSHEFLSDSLFCEWAYIINDAGAKLVIACGEYEAKLTTPHILSDNPRLDFSKVFRQFRSFFKIRSVLFTYDIR